MMTFLQAGTVVIVAFFCTLWTREINRGRPTYKLKHNILYRVVSDISSSSNLMVVQPFLDKVIWGECLFFCPKDYSVDLNIKRGSRFRVWNKGYKELLFVD